MVRIFIKLIILLVFISGSVNGQEEGILISVPKEVKAGNEFLMIISLPENHMQGVARMQIELPNGFTPEVKEKMNADFRFKNQKATFQWLSYPENQPVEVKLTITVAPQLEGYFVLKGVANWINSTEPLRSNIYPQVITVIPGETTEDMLIARQEKTKITYDDFTSEGVACIRQVPFEENGEVIVNVMVSKGDLNKYGKIQEKIPVGYRVENVKSHNAIFIFNERQQLVKYMWMNMPSTPKFIVTYKLIPEVKIDESNPFIIYGTFYYAENNMTQTVDVQERGIELDKY
ncbi:MAG: hypothetical protein PF517_03455 [Salinivirgaceae bacterium]|jgi:hypothetical protein|nr:hypothetical protein [Salinivirgaceae bacterium]